MSFNIIEKRRDVRYTFPHAIKYVLTPNTTEEIFKGFTINISDAGLCFFSSNILIAGQEIKIETKLPVSYKSGSICWSKKIDNNTYKAGLMFV